LLGNELQKVNNRLPENVTKSLFENFTSVQTHLLEFTRQVPGQVANLKEYCTNEEGQYDIQKTLHSLQEIYQWGKTSGSEKLAKAAEQTKEYTVLFVADVKRMTSKGFENAECMKVTLPEKTKQLVSQYLALGVEVKNYVRENPLSIILLKHLAVAQNTLINFCKTVWTQTPTVANSLKDQAIDVAVKFEKEHPFVTKYFDWLAAGTKMAHGKISDVAEYRMIAAGTSVLKSLDNRVLSNRGQNTLDFGLTKFAESATYAQKEWSEGVNRYQLAN